MALNPSFYAGHDQWPYIQGYNSTTNIPNTLPTNNHQTGDFRPPVATQPMDQPIWPSMLTGGASQPLPPYQRPILPAVPTQKPVPAISTASKATPTSAGKSYSSRRQLTVGERRDICIEAAANPHMKQAQIGLKFGVERSTVSKILRQKEWHMKPTPAEWSSSLPKKTERALTKRARREKGRAGAVTDEKLKKQAFLSTFTKSNNSNNIMSDPQLPKFKTKILPGTSKKIKRGSIDFPEVTVVDSSAISCTDGHLDHSPASSIIGLVSPAFSLEEDDFRRDAKYGNDDCFDFGDRQLGYSMVHGEDVSPALESGSGTRSPLHLETQRPGNVIVSAAELDGLPANASAYHLQRLQPFPLYSEETPSSRPNSSERHQPLSVWSVTASVVPQDLYINPGAVTKRSESVQNIQAASAVDMSSMRPPPFPKSEHNCPVSPGSPTPEEARHALRTLVSFFQAQPPDRSLDIDDWTSIGNMMRKLRRPRSADEDIPVNQRPIKKRTILGIST